MATDRGSVETTAIRDAAVLRALCTKLGWHTYSPQLMEILWASTTLQIVYGYLAELHKVVAHDFTPEEFRQYVASVVRDGNKLAEIEGVLGGMEDAPTISGDVLREAITQFVARTLAMETAKDIVTGHNKPDWEPSHALELLQRSTSLVQASTVPAVEDYLSSGLPDAEKDRPNCCSLGLSDKLDWALRGGAASGELIVLLAGAKKGKTTVLSRVGAHNAFHGKRVLDVTLEVSKEIRQRRYDSYYTGLDYDGLLQFPDRVVAARKRVQEAGGNIHFVDWQYEEHSPSELLPIVEQYGPFDILVLDYLELMIPDKSKAFSRREQRHLLSKLGKDIRGVAKYLGIPAVTAWQLNREGDQADTPTQHDVSECWDIMKHADAVIGLACSDEERRQKILRIYNLMQRMSERVVSVSFQADLERNVFEELP